MTSEATNLSARPPERYFRTLGLSTDATPDRVRSQYQRLSADAKADPQRIEELARAWSVLSRYFERTATTASSAPPATRTTPEERARRKQKRSRYEPPERYYAALGLRAGATRRSIDQVYQSLTETFSGDRPNAEAQKNLDHAYKILSAYHRRLAEAEAAQQTAAAAASSAKPAAEKPAPFFPPAIRKAYEQLGVTPGTSFNTVAAAYQLLTDRALKEGRSGDAETYAEAVRRIERFVEHQADRVVVIEQRVEEAAPPPPPKPEEPADPLRPYLTVLGLRDHPALPEVETAYKSIVKTLATARMDASEREQFERTRRAYKIVRQVTVRRKFRAAIVRQRRKIAVAFLLLAITTGAYGYVNRTWLSGMATHFQPGDVLYGKHDERRFGTVIAYDPRHLFSAGSEPKPAYKIRLSGSSRRIWVARSALVSAMKVTKWTPLPQETSSSVPR